MAFAPGCFCGLQFKGVSLGRNFAEFQKMCDEGVLDKLDIAQLYGHFWNRGLQQNVVLCLHFKCILIRRWCHLRQGVFVALFLEEFPLVATWRNFRKCAMRVSLPNLFSLGFTGTLGAAPSSKMLCYVCTLSAFYIRDDGICARVFLWRSFWRSFPWSQLCRISENARWGCPCQICFSSGLRAIWEPRFAAKCCAMFAL